MLFCLRCQYVVTLSTDYALTFAAGGESGRYTVTVKDDAGTTVSSAAENVVLIIATQFGEGKDAKTVITDQPLAMGTFTVGGKDANGNPAANVTIVVAEKGFNYGSFTGNEGKKLYDSKDTSSIGS